MCSGFLIVELTEASQVESAFGHCHGQFAAIAGLLATESDLFQLRITQPQKICRRQRIDRGDQTIVCCFRGCSAPTPAALQGLLERISHRVGHHLERRGLLVRDAEQSYLQWEEARGSPLDELLGAAITYRIAVGPHRGHKAFTLQTLPPALADEKAGANVARTGGFSLHAGIAAKAHQREKLERLCRYIARPAVVTERLSLTRQGDIRVALKTPYRDGTTHVVFQPLDFIARLAALVPRPRVNLTRFHGVFAPNSRYRAQITPAGRCRQGKADPNRTEPQKRRAMTWAQRLKRMFRIDIETCEFCGGAVRVIAPAHPCAPLN